MRKLMDYRTGKEYERDNAYGHGANTKEKEKDIVERLSKSLRKESQKDKFNNYNNRLHDGISILDHLLLVKRHRLTLEAVSI